MRLLLTGSWQHVGAHAAAQAIGRSPKCRARARADDAGAGVDGHGSDAELLVDQPRDLGAVGAALGLAHHVARRSGRSPWRCPGARARRRRRWRRARRRRSPASSSPPSIAARPSASTIAAGSPPSATSRSSTWRPAPDADPLGRDQPDERRERRGRDARVGRVLASSQAREQLAGDPVGERLRRAARLGAGGERRLEEVAELAAEGEHLRALGAEAELALQARGAVGGQLGHRPRARPSSMLCVDRHGHRSGSGK